MKIKLTDKDVNILRIISQIAAGFSMIVAITMIFSFVQLRIMKPLDNPVLLSLKEQYDKDPSDAVKAQQIRAMDLMARKAYFSSRWQVETGSYLLIAGVIIFIVCQRLITENDKINPVIGNSKPDSSIIRTKYRKYLMAAVGVILGASIISSILLRADLPDTSDKTKPVLSETKNEKSSGPDKTNWPFFRGQDSRGIAAGTGFPVNWDGQTAKNISWKTEIPGNGKSSPVIWEDKLFVTAAEEGTCKVYCINKNSGQILWTGSASGISGEPSVLPRTDAEAGLAVSTVATNGKFVCAVFANGNLVCFNPDGKQIWAKNIGIPESTYGYSSSLLISEGILIVQFDSNVKISLIGFDIETGEQKWETVRKGRAVWSSPVLAYFAGQPEIIVNGNPMVSAFDPANGNQLWEFECMSGDVAPSVAVNNTLAYAVTDYAKLTAIKPGNVVSVVWEDNSYTPDVSSPVANDKYLIVSTGNGDVACYNAQKGDTLWTHYFQNPFYASPIIAGDNIYLLDRSGLMHIVKAADKFSLVAESPTGEVSDCTPAFSDKKIFIRGKKNIFCISEN